jgi:hypothetical protein
MQQPYAITICHNTTGSTAAPSHPPELHYAHRRWTRSRPLSKIKGTLVTAVAWTRHWAASHTGGTDRHEEVSGTAAASGTWSSSWHGGTFWGGKSDEEAGGVATSAAVPTDRSGGPPSDSLTGSIIVGTESGSLLELSLDEKLLSQKKEVAPKTLVHGLTASGSGGICSVHQVCEDVCDVSR